MAFQNIKQPINATFSMAGNIGRLVWNPTFATIQNARFSAAQKYIDSEVLRLDDPLIPLQTGYLKKSGQLGTKVGSGEVKYIAPYAGYQYYSTPETRGYDPQRGAKWFERMKAAHKEAILRGAQAYAGGAGI